MSAWTVRPATTGITLACCHNWHSIGVLPQLALHWRPTGRLGAEALGVRLPFHRALESFPIGRFNFACSSNMRVTTVDSSTYEWWWQKYYEKGTEDQTVTVSTQGQFPTKDSFQPRAVSNQGQFPTKDSFQPRTVSNQGQFPTKQALS